MPTRRRLWTWLALAAIAASLALRAGFPKLAGMLPRCVIHHWTGWNCPGCGGTRCAQRLLNGDLAGALTMNPLVMLCAVLAGAWLGNAVLAEWRGRKAFMPSAWMGWSLFALTALFAVTRNLPWWPCTLLLPH